MLKWRIYREANAVNRWWIVDAYYANDPSPTTVSVEWWTFHVWQDAVNFIGRADIDEVEF